MARVLVDTSAVYALIDANDRHHEEAASKLRALRERRVEPLLSNFIRAECHALLLARLGPGVARRWLVSNVWSVERVSAEDEARAAEIIATHDDKAFSFTDATSFALVERLRLRRAFALDRHFAEYDIELV